ncbi:MAG: hypothetical protein K5682_07125 [Lachnospiraceae bacterium]|nr:hypothetical protein [Lachnospiraceae bacterium]
MIRGIRFFEREERINLLTLFIMLILLSAYFWLLLPESIFAETGLGPLVMSFILFMVTLVMMSDVIQSFAKRYAMMISGGILRRDVARCQLLQEIVYPIFYLLVTVLYGYIMKLEVTPAKAMTYLGIFYMGAAAGNLLSILTNKFGRTAYIIFVIMIAFAGAFFGGRSVGSGAFDFPSLNMPVLLVAGLVLLAISAIPLYKTIMNFEVRS